MSPANAEHFGLGSVEAHLLLETVTRLKEVRRRYVRDSGDGKQFALTEDRLDSIISDLDGWLKPGGTPIKTGDLDLRLAALQEMIESVGFPGYARVIATQVNGGEVEFGLAVRMGTHYELDFKPVMTEHFVAVCRRDHPLADRGSVSWDELSEQCLIGNTVINSALRMSSNQPYWDFEAEQISTAVSFVKHGLGITLLPEFEQQQPGYQDLRTLRVTGPGVSREVGFITRPDMPLSRPASVLMDLIAAQFQVVAQRAERIGTGKPERPA